MNTDMATHGASHHLLRRPTSLRHSPSCHARSRRAGPCRYSEGSCSRPMRDDCCSRRDRHGDLDPCVAIRRASRVTRASSFRDGSSPISSGCLPDESVTLAYDEGEGVLTVTSGQPLRRASTSTAPRTSHDFLRSTSHSQKIEAAALLATIDKVGRAASRDESRPVLTGVLVRFEGDKLVMAATDSYRLAVKETELSTHGPDLDAIIPARALQELARLASSARGRRAWRAREPRHLLGRATSG